MASSNLDLNAGRGGMETRLRPRQSENAFRKLQQLPRRIPIGL